MKIVRLQPTPAEMSSPTRNVPCMLLYGATRRVDPHLPVQVRHNEQWCTGSLEAWRKEGEGWRAYVRYKAHVEMTYLTWVDWEDVREGAAPPGGA
jgi:hypothetical protein